MTTFEDRVEAFIARKRVEMAIKNMRRKLERARKGAKSVLVALEDVQRVIAAVEKKEEEK